MPGLTKRPVAVVAASAVALLAAGVVWAAIPDGTGTIHACQSPSDKSLRVVDTGACAKGEAPVSWSQNAVRGPQGPQGPQGQPGNAGPHGAPGLTRATGAATLVQENTVIGGLFAALTCPAGTKALQGRYQWDFLIGGMPPQNDVESFPSGDDGWDFAVGANSKYKGAEIFLFLDCVTAN
jgi:hypothetical protein